MKVKVQIHRLLILLKPTTCFSHEEAALQESASEMQHVKSCLEKDSNNKNISKNILFKKKY